MNTDSRAAAELGQFAATAPVPSEATRAAQTAWLDTIGVMLAGSVEPPARMVQNVCTTEGAQGKCHVLGTALATGAASAALANGTAAHALDYDDMCFVSLAHPSAPLVAAALAAGELTGVSGRSLLEAYVVGFEIECIVGRAVNPSHYARGWHCTSTLGSIGAAAAVARLRGLDATAAAHAVAIAASAACGLKENFGTMVKPLHAGLAARNGVTAAFLAAEGFTASRAAVDGPQGFVAATSDESRDLTSLLGGLGSRWEIIETGVTVKLYPSCAATHPSLDALLDLRRQHRFQADDVESIEIAVDAVTPTVLIYSNPRGGLEAKFSMQFCAAAAAVMGRVGIDTFDDARVGDPAIRRLQSRVVVRVDEALGESAPALTQAHVTVKLTGGAVLSARADGARGYPERPASPEELDAKFRACASRAADPETVEDALAALQRFDQLADVRLLTTRLAKQADLRV
jgi:2-methylcitrate dehydratase PrpD